MRAGPTPLLLLLLATSAFPQPERTEVRGITISTHRAGREWGDPPMVPTMEAIRETGANWVAIHPYAGIRRDGSVRWRRFGRERPPRHVVAPIRMAHELGLKILIKPHLAYWGSGFGWRGDITFEDEAAWQRFFAGYRSWIAGLAAVSKEADGFVIGTELDRTLGHEAEWRRIVREVRAVTKVPLTYAANWSDYEKVGFWDALDVVGIQAYFPLSRRRQRDPAALRRAWAARMRELHAFAEEQGRDIVFTELGYSCSLDAAVRPWDHRQDGPAALPVQEACLRAALEAVEEEPRVLGAFLWKWFPEPRPVGRDFRMASPRMRRVISSIWRQG